MNDLKDAFLELVKEISENLAGSLNLGLNSADEFHDRLDFLLVFVMLGFSSSYGRNEYSMYQAIHEEYVRKLAEKEKQLELEEKEQLLIAKKEDGEYGEQIEGEVGEGGVVQASLDEAAAANVIAVARVISIVTSLAIGALSTRTTSASASASSDNNDPDPFSSPDVVSQVIATIQEIARIASITEDDTAVTVNFFTTAQSLGIDITSADFLAAFEALFSGGDTFSPPQCTFAGLTVHRIDSGAIVAGDFIFTPVAAAQPLAEGQIGNETYTFDFPALGINNLRVNVGIAGKNDAPVPPPNTVRNVDDNTAGVPILFVDILGNTTDPDTGAALSVIAVTIDNQVVPVGGTKNGVTVTATGILIDFSFFDAQPGGAGATPLEIEFLVSDGTTTATFLATFNVMGANDPPTTADGAVAQVDPTPLVDTDATQHVFSSADFNPVDLDMGDVLSIVIDSLPGVGTLTTVAGPVTVGQVIPIADIAAVALTHTAPASSGGNTGFLFRVTDGTDFSSQQTITITMHNDAPNISWLGFTNLPRFLVEDNLLDDPITNATLPMPMGVAAVADEVDLQHYISDQEGNLTFSNYMGLPFWIPNPAGLSSKSGNTFNVLTDNGTRPTLDFLNTFASVAVPHTNPTNLTSVSVTITDDQGSILPVNFEILNFRLDFDATGSMNNANPNVAPTTGGTVTADVFTPNAPTDPTQAGNINILNAGGELLANVAAVLDWALVGGLYQITAGLAGTTSTALFTNAALPISATTVATNFKLNIGNDADPTSITARRGLLGTSGNDDPLGAGTGVSLTGGTTFSLIFGLDGNDVLRGDTALNLVGAGLDQLLVGGPGNDRVIGDASGIIPFGVTGGADIISSVSGTNVLIGDADGDISGAGGIDMITGGTDADTIFGETDANLLAGSTAANDVLNGGAGADRIVGDAGGTIAAGATGGADTINGEVGVDTILGDADGSILGTAGNDIIDGGTEGDFIFGDTDSALPGIAGDDTLTGGTGGDTIVTDTNIGAYGTKGIDTVFGGEGDDSITGGRLATAIKSAVALAASNTFRYNMAIDNGDDTINNLVTNQHATLSAGRGIFNFFNATGETVSDLAQLLGFRVTAGNYVADISSSITFNSASTFDPTTANNLLDVQLDATDGSPASFVVALSQNVLYGTSAVPVALSTPAAGFGTFSLFYLVAGTAGVDGNFVGGDGTAAVAGGASQVFSGGLGNDTLWGETKGNHTGVAANDILAGGPGDDTLIGDAEGNLAGTAGNDTLLGEAGNDLLVGDSVDDLLAGAFGGNDFLFGGTGNDTLWGDSVAGGAGTKGNDTFKYNISNVFVNGQDTIEDFDFTNAGSVADDTIQLINVAGSALGNLTIVMTIKNAGGVAGATQFVDLGIPTGVMPAPALDDSVAITGSAALMSVNEYMFEIVDTAGSSATYSVLAGEADAGGLISDTSTTADRLVIDALGAFGAITTTTYSFDLSTAATPTKAISFFDVANQSLRFDVSGAIGTVATHTQVRDSPFDVDRDGMTDAFVDVFDGGGTLTGTVLLGEVNFDATLGPTLGTELSDYGIAAAIV